MSDEIFMREAIALARANVEAGGRPSRTSTAPNCRRSARPVRRSAARVWTVV